MLILFSVFLTIGAVISFIQAGLRAEEDFLVLA